MKNNSRFKRLMKHVGTFLAIGIVMYGFLAVCNWSIQMKDWGGFSRFLMAILGVLFFITMLDEF
jgi:hypothetical protein